MSFRLSVNENHDIPRYKNILDLDEIELKSINIFKMSVPNLSNYKFVFKKVILYFLLI